MKRLMMYQSDDWRWWLLQVVAFGLIIASVVAAKGAPTPVYVGIPPIAYLAERVGGDAITVSVLLPPGQEVETYEPTPRDMAGLAQTAVYFSIDLPFEKRLVSKASATMKDLSVIDIDRGLPRRMMEEAHNAPGEGGHHHEGGADPHIWLDPQNARLMAQVIAAKLARLLPRKADYFNANLKSLEEELEWLDSMLTAELAPYRGRPVYVFHPAYGYFTDRYGLKQVAVESAGKEPGAKGLADVIERARNDKVVAIIVQPQFTKHAAEAVAREIGGRIIVADPLGRDYPGMLQDLAQAIRQALGDE